MSPGWDGQALLAPDHFPHGFKRDGDCGLAGGGFGQHLPPVIIKVPHCIGLSKKYLHHFPHLTANGCCPWECRTP